MKRFLIPLLFAFALIFLASYVVGLKVRNAVQKAV